MDFAGKDGWRMYHGDVVPGFPQHPHRGFETVTYVRKGLIDHSDSLGATARFGRGDVQWLTAGGGIVHSEMFPLVDRDAPNPVELFQIWLNLPAARKMDDPYFTMIWADDIPKVELVDDDGHRVVLTVIAGAVDGVTPPPPPPSSWASTPESDLAIWHLAFEPGSSWTLPPAAGPDTIRTLYVFDGESVQIGEHDLARDTGSVLRCDEPVAVSSRAGRRGARPPGPPDRRAGRPAGPLRDERRGRAAPDVPRLPAHRLRRLALARPRPGARRRRGPLRAPPRRPDRTRRRGHRLIRRSPPEAQ